jgi:hypothetical protein
MKLMTVTISPEEFKRLKEGQLLYWKSVLEYIVTVEYPLQSPMALCVAGIYVDAAHILKMKPADSGTRKGIFVAYQL